MKLKKRNTYGVVSPCNTLTQGSSLCSPTLGYQKQNPYGVRLPNEKLSLCAPLPFEREKIKKAQYRWRCAPCNTLTQGSSLRLPTLDYQKQNPDGVRQFANILCAALPFEMAIKSGIPMGFVNSANILCTPLFHLKWLSKAEGYGVRQFANILCACSSFWNGYQKWKAMGFVSFTNPAKRLCRRSPLLGEGWGEALMLRLYSKLGIFLWFSLLFRIFHQT
ncbi:hypothetical protein [Segatella salivae]